MKRRVLSVMLAAALCLGLLPGRAEAADGLPDTFYLSIGGAVIQSGGSGQADLNDLLGDGTVSVAYENLNGADKWTIRLKSASLSKGITVRSGVVELVLEGENSISSERDGITLSGALTVSGTGSLHVDCKQGTAIGVSSLSSHALLDGTVTLQNSGTLVLEAEALAINTVGALRMTGVEMTASTTAPYNPVIRGGKDIHITDSSISAKGTGENAGAISPDNGDIVITNSSIDLECTDTGLSAGWGDVNVTESDIRIAASGGYGILGENVSFKGESTIDTSGGWGGLYAQNLNIGGGRFHAKTTGGDYMAVYVATQSNTNTEAPTPQITLGSGLAEAGGGEIACSGWYENNNAWEYATSFADGNGRWLQEIIVCISDADYTAVDAALARVPADLTKYTDESAAALQAAVSAVVRGLYASEQARVDGFARAIEAALAGLAGKPADYTAVDAALAKIPSDLTKYTSESAAALQAAAGAVVRDLTALEQEQVDNFARAIEAALAGLVEKPDTPDRPAPPDSPGEPSRPSGSSGSTAKPSLPVYTDTGIQDGKSAPETTAVPPAVVRGTTATAKVDAATGREIIKQAVEHGSERVIIAPDIAGEVTETEVSLPASTISELHSRTGASLTISTPAARVTIPNEGLGCLASGSGNVTAAAKRSGSILSLSITAEGSPVTDIPGGITLIVPVEYAFPGTVAALVRPDGTREIIRKSIAADGSVIIPLRGSAVVEIMDNSKRFADVPAESWAADAAAFASARELFGGTGPDTFSPGAPMTRGMLAAVLHNLEGNPVQAASVRFSDVEDGAWYAAGIRWAAACGIVDGYSGGLFGPGDTITREQLAVMLWRYAGRPAPTRLRLDFPDADQVSGWALDALCWAAEQGILNGRGSLLAPSGFATRAEAAQMLKNFLERT